MTFKEQVAEELKPRGVAKIPNTWGFKLFVAYMEREGKSPTETAKLIASWINLGTI